MRLYQSFLSVKPVCMVLLMLVGFHSNLMGQENTVLEEVDTLAYEIKDTLPVIEPPAFKTNTEEEEISEEEEEDNSEYFLRKEFTGFNLDSIHTRKLSPATKKNLDEDDAFWYANEHFTREKESASNNNISFLSGRLAQTVLWILIIGGFLAFLFLYLSNSQVRLFRKSLPLENEDVSPDAGDIFAVNYETEINKAVAAANYRLAVRLMFLRLLRNMSDRNLIRYKQDSTNFDYLLQLRSGAHYADFFRITRNYEFTWYGQFDIDAGKYDVIKKDFDQFETKFSR